MTVFDIMGPVMVGPSSSHTAGAVRIGRLTRALLGAAPVRAEIRLHGSFSATGRGHGTDRALTAGLLGMEADDPRLPQSLSLAREVGLYVTFEPVTLPHAHPNTAVLTVTAADGRTLTVTLAPVPPPHAPPTPAVLTLTPPDGRTLPVTAASLGGSRVKVTGVDDLEVSFSGDLPTLLLRNRDRPGIVAEVAQLLSAAGVNIATLHLHREGRGGLAAMVVESDQPLPGGLLKALAETDGIESVRYLDPKGGA